MIARATFLTLLAIFAITWLQADSSGDIRDLWLFEIVRTATLWFCIPLGLFAMDEWVRA